MPTPIERRRSRFLKALARAQMSQNAWAKSNGVSKAHLSLVLAGKRDSASLTERIDAFIAGAVSIAAPPARRRAGRVAA